MIKRYTTIYTNRKTRRYYGKLKTETLQKLKATYAEYFYYHAHDQQYYTTAKYNPATGWKDL